MRQFVCAFAAPLPALTPSIPATFSHCPHHRPAHASRSPRRRRPPWKCTAELPDDDASAPNDVAMTVEARTMAWARGIVVGLNLCPFAKAALERGSVRTVVTPAVDEAALRGVVEREANLLVATPRSQIETTLIVAMAFASDDFLRFHEFATELEESLEKDDFFGERVMVACFHPEHCWGDAESVHSAENFDKRAPYPVVNLLRFDQVSEYVDEGLTEDILDRNLETLRELGSEKLLDMYRNLVP